MAQTFIDILNTIVGGAFGGDWTFFALIIMAIIAFICFKYRFPTILALGLAFITTYSFRIMTGASGILDMILVILGLGIIVIIISALFKYASRGSQ